jgi:hypothetical protein
MEHGKLTWKQVKELVKKENENVEKRSEEIRKYDSETSKRLHKKSKFVTNDSIKFTREEYDKLKTAFCKGKEWDLEYPHTVNVRSITLTGNYKWMPELDVEFRIEIEGQEKDSKTEASNNDTKIDIEKEKLKA